MKQNIEILKSIFLPLFEKSNNEKTTSIDWDKLVESLISYSDNPVITEKEISKFPFKNKQQVLSELPEIYDTFLDELAEQYVLGNQSDLAEELLKTNTLFKEKVSFYTLMKGVLTKMGRKQIVDELKAEEVFSDHDIEVAFKKKEREELRSKFKEWDKELAEEDNDTGPAEEVKVVSLWQKYAKYAIAASIALLIGVFYFTSDNTITHTTKLKYASAPTEKIKILTNTGLGYTDPSVKKEITVVFIPSGETTSHNSYHYQNDTLRLFRNKPNKKIVLLEYENSLYLKINEDFYPLKISKNPIDLQKLEKEDIEEQLEKILFNNH